MDTLTATERREQIRRISLALHELCQPLTTLHCRMELARMIGTPEAYQEAVDFGLEDCARVCHEMGVMRDMVRAAIEDIASK